MAEDFLGAFVGDQVRAKLLRVFVFAQAEPLTLRLVAKRAGTSVQAAERGIRTLEKMGVIRASRGLPAPRSAWKVKAAKAKKRPAAERAWVFNAEFKHARALAMFVHEVSPLQHRHILDTVKRAGKVSLVVISGALMGDPTRPVELLVAGDGLNEGRLEAAVRSLEPQVGREMRYASFSIAEFQYRLTIQDRLIRDTIDFPHLVLLDRRRLVS